MSRLLEHVSSVIKVKYKFDDLICLSMLFVKTKKRSACLGGQLHEFIIKCGLHLRQEIVKTGECLNHHSKFIRWLSSSEINTGHCKYTQLYHHTQLGHHTQLLIAQQVLFVKKIGIIIGNASIQNNVHPPSVDISMNVCITFTN